VCVCVCVCNRHFNCKKKKPDRFFM
jgi:hypothetical protein